MITGPTIVIGILVLAILVLGANYLKAPTGADILAGDGKTLSPDVETYTKFGDDNIGYFRPAVYNSMDTTAVSYTVEAIRVYQLDSVGVESYYGSVTTATSGVGARAAANTLAITGYDNDQKLYKYVAYVQATNNVSTSGRFEFTASEDVVKEYGVPNQSQLIFKVYDEEQRGYLNTSGSIVAAGQSNVSGDIWVATGSTSVGTSVGTGGYYDYTIYFSENGTQSTSNQFEDQILLVAVDGQDLSDWQTPSLSLPGATITQLSPGEYNDKIKNNGFDWIFKVTNADGTPYHVDSTWSKLRIQQYAKTAVDATDDINVSFLTGGWYQATTGSAMKMDTHKDDSSQTAVFAANTLNFVIT